MSEQLKKEPILVDPYGRPFPATPKAPQSNAVVIDEDNRPVSAASLSRRDFVGQTLCVLTMCFAGTSAFMDLFGHERSTNVIPHEPDVARCLRKTFPFLFEDPHRVAFHPNADNQRLAKLRTGVEDATPADHLRSHSISLQTEIPASLFAPNRLGFLRRKRDLEVYSHMTLLQAHALRGAMFGSGVSVEAVRGSQQFVRQAFSPNGTNVIIGSPTGNRLASIFRGKRRRSEPGRQRELRHEGIYGLHFPFEFSLDADLDPGIRAGTEYAWSIHAQRDPKASLSTYKPILGETSYFTVSVIPNFLSTDMNHVPPILLFEGCTALGTSGISGLLVPSAIGEYGALLALEQHVRENISPYWQALFMVGGVERRMSAAIGVEEDYASYIELVDFAWIRPNEELYQYRNLARGSLESASAQLMRRLNN